MVPKNSKEIHPFENNELLLSMGGQGCIYSPLRSTIALGSNQLKRMHKITSQRRWRQDPQGGT